MLGVGGGEAYLLYWKYNEVLSECCSTVWLRKAQKMCPVALRQGEKQASSNLCCNQFSNGTLLQNPLPWKRQSSDNSPAADRSGLLEFLCKYCGTPCSYWAWGRMRSPVHKEAGVLCESSSANRQELGKGCLVARDSVRYASPLILSRCGNSRSQILLYWVAELSAPDGLWRRGMQKAVKWWPKPRWSLTLSQPCYIL